MGESDVSDCRTHNQKSKSARNPYGSIPDLRGYTVTFYDLFDSHRWCGIPNETRESRARRKGIRQYFGNYEYGALNEATGVITGRGMLADMVEVEFTDIKNGIRWSPGQVPAKYLWDLRRVESTYKKFHAALAKERADLAKVRQAERIVVTSVSDMDLD